MTAGAAWPKVAALVPTWKASRFIVSTLNALAAQSYPNLEVLISDDASPDDTAAVCDAFAARDARFRVIRQPRNLGWTGNVNALLREARGDYLVFAFHDDLLAPRYVERCVAALEANAQAVLAFTDIALVDRNGGSENLRYDVLDGVADRLQRARCVARRQDHWWIPNRGVFRASVVPAIGGLRRHFAGEVSADWPWLLHMSLLGPFVRVPERLCTKVLGPESLSRNWDSGPRSHFAVAISAMGAISRAKVSAREKFALRAIVAAFAARQLGGWIRHALGQWLRGLGLRRSVPGAGRR